MVTCPKCGSNKCALPSHDELAYVCREIRKEALRVAVGILLYGAGARDEGLVYGLTLFVALVAIGLGVTWRDTARLRLTGYRACDKCGELFLRPGGERLCRRLRGSVKRKRKRWFAYAGVRARRRAFKRKGRAASGPAADSLLEEPHGDRGAAVDGADDIAELRRALDKTRDE